MKIDTYAEEMRGRNKKCVRNPKDGKEKEIEESERKEEGGRRSKLDGQR